VAEGIAKAEESLREATVPSSPQVSELADKPPEERPALTDPKPHEVTLAGVKFAVRELPVGRLKDFWRRADAVLTDLFTTYRQQGKVMDDGAAQELSSMHLFRFAYMDADLELVAAALSDQQTPRGERVTRQWLEDNVFDPADLSAAADVVWEVNVLGPKLQRRIEAMLRRMLRSGGQSTSDAGTSSAPPPGS
jgi:hypothetical protein